MKKIGFIGCGIMGTALATAACKGIDPSKVAVTDILESKASALAEELKCSFMKTNEELVKECQYIVFCVKPQFLKEVLTELQLCFKTLENKVIVSIVAGVESSTYTEMLNLEGKNISIIRMLPNTACLIGKGFTIVMKDITFTEDQLAEYEEIMKESGKFDSLPPSQFVAGTVLTSTSPAFTAMYANSLADGGVTNGLLRNQARKLALEGILGTIQLLLTSDKHLEQLKDDVCSPAGPAMVGVKTLEDRSFRSTVINAVADAYNRFGSIGKI